MSYWSNDRNHIPISLRPVVTAQNKILRSIFRKPKYDKKKKLQTASSPLYKKLEVLKFQDLYYYNLAILAHDYFYSNNFPSSLTEKFDNIRSKSLHETRGRDRILNYQVPNLHNTYRKPTTACSMLWNSLPLEIKNTSSKSSFKLKLKCFFIDKY